MEIVNLVNLYKLIKIRRIKDEKMRVKKLMKLFDNLLINPKKDLANNALKELYRKKINNLRARFGFYNPC